MCGVKTNVVSAVEIHEQFSNDGPLLKPMLSTTKARFNVEELSADMGYLSESNFQAITDAGAKAFIPFKCNSAPTREGVWNTAFHFFYLHREEFLRSLSSALERRIDVSYGESEVWRRSAEQERRGDEK